MADRSCVVGGGAGVVAGVESCEMVDGEDASVLVQRPHLRP